MPRGRVNLELIPELEASGLLGRGGAGFPVGRKWRALAEREGGPAVVVANGAEGEIASAKDRVLMAYRPHLVIDGALLAAEAIGADEVVFYIGSEHDARHSRRWRMRFASGTARSGSACGSSPRPWAMLRARRPPPSTTSTTRSRGPRRRRRVRRCAACAACRPSCRTWRASPTLRSSPGSAKRWYRSAGRRGVRRDGARHGQRRCRHACASRRSISGATVGELALAAGATPARTRAVILGGYFGTWASVEDVWALPLDPAVMRAEGLAFGCGMVGLLPTDRCGVRLPRDHGVHGGRERRPMRSVPVRAAAASPRPRRGSRSAPADRPTSPTSSAGCRSSMGGAPAITRMARSS